MTDAVPAVDQDGQATPEALLHPLDRPHDDGEIARLTRGDTHAFEALFERLQPRILSITRRLVGSAHAAEDVAQETWQAVHRALPTFEGACHIDTWVLQIALNHARTAYARNRRGRAEEEGSDGLENAFGRIGAWARPLEEWPSLAASPEEMTGHRELLALVSAALDALPELSRLVVVMCDVEGLDPKTAAEALGITPVNCRTVLHRGRMRVRAALAAALIVR